MVQNEIESVQIAAADSVLLQNGLGKFTLQRGEAETIFLVSLENELHGAIAETADTVVQNDRV